MYDERITVGLFDAYTYLLNTSFGIAKSAN
jgi:hypothetical protein